MNDNIVSKISDIRDKLIDIPIKFGVPTYQQLLIRQRVASVNKYKDTIITPFVKVTKVSPKSLSGAYNNIGINISQDDYLIKGITRKNYSIEFLNSKNTLFLIINPIFDGNKIQIIGGIVCEKPLYIEDKSPITFNLILRPKPDIIKFPIPTEGTETNNNTLSIYD